MLTKELIVQIVHLQRADEHNLLEKDDVPPSTKKKKIQKKSLRELTLRNSAEPNDGKNSFFALQAHRVFRTSMEISSNMYSAQLNSTKLSISFSAGIKLAELPPL